MRGGGALRADKIIKLIAAVVLFGICMAFRNDVTELWLRAVLATLGFGLLGWGVAQIFWKPK